MYTILTELQKKKMTLEALITYEYEAIAKKFHDGNFLEQEYQTSISHKTWAYHRAIQNQIIQRIRDEEKAYNFTREQSNHRMEIERHIPFEEHTTLKENCDINIQVAANALPKHIAAITIAHDLYIIEREEAEERENQRRQQLDRRPQTAKTNKQKAKPKRRNKPKR